MTSIEKEQIIDKVKKLLSLSKGSTFEGEIDTALQKARDILAKHNMDMDEVEMNNSGEVEVEEVNISDGYWQGRLAGIIGDYFGCSSFYTNTWYSKKRKISFAGMKVELQICVYTYIHVSRQIYNVCYRKKQEFFKAKGIQYPSRRSSLSYTHGFVNGVLERLEERFQERLERESTGKDLVLVKNPKVEEWEAFAGIREADARFTTISASNEAHSQGYEEGDNITLHAGVKNEKKTVGRLE